MMFINLRNSYIWDIKCHNYRTVRSLFYHSYLSPTVGRRGWPNRGGPIEGPGPGGSIEVKRYSCVQALNIVCILVHSSYQEAPLPLLKSKIHPYPTWTLSLIGKL